MIVEDVVDDGDGNIEETPMSIEETGDVVVDDNLLGAASSSLEMAPPLAFKDISKAKGISKSTIAREINFTNYQQALDTLQPQRHTVRRIKSERHTLYLEETLKSSISVADSKRFWSSKYQSFAFGNILTRPSASSISTWNLDDDSSPADEEQLD